MGIVGRHHGHLLHHLARIFRPPGSAPTQVTLPSKASNSNQKSQENPPVDAQERRGQKDSALLLGRFWRHSSPRTRASNSKSTVRVQVSRKERSSVYSVKLSSILTAQRCCACCRCLGISAGFIYDLRVCERKRQPWTLPRLCLHFLSHLSSCLGHKSCCLWPALVQSRLV